MAHIFISYRRADSEEMSRRIYDALIRRVGEKNVFRDVDSLIKGHDFRAGIERFIFQSDVMLVLIGDQWLNIRDDKTQERRLDNPDDFVRIEVDMGLRHVQTVIPVLVNEASMPGETDLPVRLSSLTFKNAVQMRASHFDADLEELFGAIGIPDTLPWWRRPTFMGVVAFFAIFILIGVWLVSSTDRLRFVEQSPDKVTEVVDLLTSTPIFLSLPDHTTGEGGSIVHGNQASVDTLNPLFCSNSACDQLIDLLFPKLVGVDPETGIIKSGTPGSLALDWKISPDGLVYTFNLRNDWNWSDGTPIHAENVVYAWNAISSGEIDTPLSNLTASISDVHASGPNTLDITFKTPDCSALQTASYLPVLPSHLFSDDYAELRQMDLDQTTSVTAGVFQVAEIHESDNIRLIPSRNYPDAQDNVIRPTRFIYRFLLDENKVVDEFLAGNTNVIVNPSLIRRDDIRAAAVNGEILVYEYPGTQYSFFAFNLADPTNPQPGLDEDGTPIEQGHHPIFGDPRVRRAIIMSINRERIGEVQLFGEATEMVSNVIPTSWAYNSDLQSLPYSPETAAALLEEAGWVDGDGDGFREAENALFAPKNTPLKFSIYTNAGNTARETTAIRIQADLAEIGIQVETVSLDFNALIELIYGQRFDTFILGATDTYPYDPDQTDQFLPGADSPGTGFNFTSYNNPQVTELMRQARVLPGCDVNARAEIYQEIQRIMQEDPPYIWLYVQNNMYAVRSNIHGFDPHPHQLYWNVAEWFVTP